MSSFGISYCSSSKGTNFCWDGATSSDSSLKSIEESSCGIVFCFFSLIEDFSEESEVVAPSQQKFVPLEEEQYEIPNEELESE